MKNKGGVMDLQKVLLGLNILGVHGYEEVQILDRCIVAGSSVDNDYVDTMLHLGWDWDEDNSEWYYLAT